MRFRALLQKLAVGLLLLALFVTASVAGFALHLDLPRGRRLVADVIGSLLGSELSGSFSVAGVERIRPGTFVVRDFEVKDPQGRAVLRVSRVTLRAALLAMARDLVLHPERTNLDFDAVELERAEAQLFDDKKTGVPSLALAFEPRPRPANQPSKSTHPVHVRLRAISLSRGYVRGSVSTLPTLELDVSQLRGAATITERAIDLELERFGVLARGVGGADARGVAKLRLHEPGWVETSFDGFFGDVQVGSSLRVEGDRVFATLELPRATPGAMRGVLPGYPLQRDVTLHAEASGRPPELGLRARFESGATHLDGSGTLRVEAEPSFALDVDARELDASALAVGLPPSRLDLNARVTLQSKPGGPRVQVLAATLPGEIDQIAVPASEVELSFENDTLSGNLLLKEPGLPVRGTFLRKPNGAFDLHAESSGVELSRAPRLRKLPGSGVAGVKLDAHVEGGKLRLSADGDVRDFRRGDLAVGHATFEARANGPLSNLQALNIDASLNGEDAVSGGLRFSKVLAKARGTLQSPDVTLKLDDLRGGALEVAARVGAQQGATQVSGLTLSYKREQAVVSGSLKQLRVEGDEIEVEGAELRGLGGELRGSLVYRRHLLSIDGSGKALRIGDLARLLGLPSHYVSGVLDFDADVLLARDIERGKVSLRLTDASLGPLPDVTSTLSAQLEDGRLQGDASISVRNVADATGRFDLLVPGSVRDEHALRDTTGEVALDVTQINLELLSQVLAPGRTPPLQGKLALGFKATRRVPYALPSVSLAGYTAGLAVQPALLSPSMPALTGVDAQFGVNVSGESGDAEASLKLVDARGTLGSASLSTHLDLVELVKDPRGVIAKLPDAQLLGKVLIDERKLSEFPQGLLPRVGDGRLRVDASLSGSFNHPIVSGRVRVGGFEAASVGGSRPLDLCASLAWDQATRRLGSSGEVFLTNPARPTCEGTRVALYTVLGALGAERLEGSAVVSLERLPVDAVPGFADAGMSGRLSGRASLTQNGPIPSLSANLSLSDARVQGVAVGDGKLEVRSNEQALGLTLELKKGAGSLQATALAALDYSGVVPVLRDGEPIGVRVTANKADAVVLSPFVKDVLSDFSGTLDADISARIAKGEGEEAGRAGKIQGTLTLHEGAFELSGLGLKLQGVELNASAEPEANQTRINMPLLTARSTKGQRAIAVRNARVWLQGFTLARAEGSVDASELPLSLPGIPQATATTRQSIAFDVKRTPREMQATINVPYLVVALPQAAARDLISLDENRSIAIVQPIGQPGQASGDGLPWRFAFDLGQNVKLTRPDLDLPLSGHAEVLLAQPIEVSGDVDLSPGGRIDVSGKTFVVETGEVHFDTGDPSNPRIRVTATFRPPDGSIITADVSGTLKQATLTLSSPSRDLQQIYAVLLGGSGNDGGDARAAGAGVGADQLLGPLLANTPLRNVEIRTGSQLSADRRSYSTYSAAVPISDQVWFEGSYKTLNSQDSRVQGSAVSGTVDFRFRRNWSLRTEVGTIGTGVDLLWNYRY